MCSISIIIPTYNAASTIEATLLSIVSQSIKDYEVIIIDGCSTDNTITIVNQYKSHITTVICEEDKGIYDAMNKGIGMAKGRFIYFLGADDTLYNDKILETVIPLLQGNKVYYGQAFFLKRNTFYDGPFNTYKLALRNICHQAIFYPAGLLKNNLYNLQYRLLSDYDLNLKLYGSSVPYIYINLVIANFNDTASSASAKDAAFEAAKLSLVKKHLGLFPYYYALSRRVLKGLLYKK